MNSMLIQRLTDLPARVQRRLQRTRLYVRYRSRYANVFHACVQKTASSWLRQILSDPRTYRYSGLRMTLPPVDHRTLWEKRLDFGLTPGTLVSPLYVAWEGYASLRPPTAHTVFFVMRDPRDLIVSWYFSARFSHPVEGNPPLAAARAALERLDADAGLHYSIDYLGQYGIYHALETWHAAAARDASILLLRFEDLTGPQQAEVFEQFLVHCDIRMPARVRGELLADWAFKQLARAQPATAVGHYRKGAAGDWRNHFTSAHEQRMLRLAPGLLATLGYR